MSSIVSTCARYVTAENDSDWDVCFELLAGSVQQRVKTPNRLMVFVSDASLIRVDSDKAKPPLIMLDSSNNYCFVKYWRPLPGKKGYIAAVFMLTRKEDGKYAIASAFPSRLSNVFLRP
jgi:hypothetical protein